MKSNDGRERLDALVRDLIAGARQATPADIEKITERIAEAPFSTRLVKVSRQIRGREYLGHRFATKARSDWVHLAKRVLLERQWRKGTSFEEYLGDLRAAISHEARRLVIYSAHGLNFVGVLSPNVVPADRLGERPEPYLYVLYDTDHDTITTGYQVSGAATISLPKDARWLT